MQDQPPPRARIADWAFERLQEAIFEGEIEPGQHLAVPTLAEQLNISRSPVREAVQRLIREGLAEEQPHRGAVVAVYGAGELAAVYEIREVLEGLAARLAAQHADESFVDDLTEAHEQHEIVVKADDQSAHVAQDMRFHELTRQAAGNAWLAELLDQIRGRIQLAMLSTSVSGGKEQAVREHREILRAIQQRDPEAAERAARAHVARLRDALRARAAGDVHGVSVDGDRAGR